MPPSHAGPNGRHLAYGRRRFHAYSERRWTAAQGWTQGKETFGVYLLYVGAWNPHGPFRPALYQSLAAFPWGN